MLKISFKDDYKTVKRFNEKTTVVTLKGYIKMPKFWPTLPEHIENWCINHGSVEFDECWAYNTIILKVQGKTTIRGEDADYPEKAKRIAESKAKIKLYRFMYTLTYKIMKYYRTLMFGEEYFTVSSKEGICGQVTKYRDLYLHELQHFDYLKNEHNN